MEVRFLFGKINVFAQGEDEEKVRFGQLVNEPWSALVGGNWISHRPYRNEYLKLGMLF
jgi:hypothetical protein